MIVKVPNDAQHPAGTTVTLNAVPLTGYQFTRWEGDVTGAVSPTTIVMNGNRSVTAVFTALPPATLSVIV